MQEKFEFYLSASESKLLLMNMDGNVATEATATKLGRPHATAALPDVFEIDSLPDTDTAGECSSPAEATIASNPSDVTLFLYTSNTMSRSNGVPLNQHNIIASVDNICMRIGGITWYTVVPTMHHIMLDCHTAMQEESYLPMRFIQSCSVSLAHAVLQCLEDAFVAPMLEAYTMKEAAYQMCTNPLLEDGPHKLGRWGMRWVRRWWYSTITGYRGRRESSTRSASGGRM